LGYLFISAKEINGMTSVINELERIKKEVAKPVLKHYEPR
jgi:hypothetical protein